MNEKYLAALITSVVGIGVVIYFTAVVYKNQMYGALGIAVAMAVELVIMLLAGLILVGNQKTRPIGNGILIGACITLVIGFGICSSSG